MISVPLTILLAEGPRQTGPDFGKASPAGLVITLILLIAVVALVWLERQGRSRQRFGSAQRMRAIAPHRLPAGRAWLATLACSLPVLIGFAAPAAYLAWESGKRLVQGSGVSEGLVSSLLNTLGLALGVTVIAVAAGLVVAWATRTGISTRAPSRWPAQLAALGYAVPGTVLAIGLLTPALAFDAGLAQLFGMNGLPLMGQGIVLVAACVIRFLVMPVGGIEAGLARTLGIRVGDTLSFDLAGRTVRAPVTSLREVRWDSFRVNFFVLASPGLLAGEPASLVSSFYLPPDRLVAFEQALARFPGVTVVDVTALLNEVRQLTDRLAQAVEFLFGFTLAAGLVTLVAATVATQAERARDAALLRTLGATRRQLLAVLLGEFLWLGVLAGVLAALGAGALGWAVGFWVLDLTLLPSPWLLLAGVGLCGLAALLAGGWAVRRVLAEPPAARLRALSAV